MKMISQIENIIGSIKKTYNRGVYNEVIWEDNIPVDKNEFLFFIKPEITLNSKNIHLKEILKLIFNKIEEFNLSVKSARILSAEYLKTFDIIASHYGVINRVSRNVLRNINQEVKEKFEKLYRKDISQCTIYGSLEFLNHYPHLNATSLDYLWQNGKVEKLGGGMYSQHLKIDSEEIYLVNGFHPRQLDHFTRQGRNIIVFILTGNTDWNIARNDFIGKTNPQEAKPGSIRHELLLRKEMLGLEAVNSSWNGVHLSAGPVEALVEIIRYSSNFDQNKLIVPDDILFGRMLLKEFGAAVTLKFLENCTLNYEGKEYTVFDLTEEKNPDEVLKLLKGSVIKKE